MKAYVVPNADVTTLEGVKLADVPKPSAAPGEVLVKVKAVGLNPVDWKLVAGHNPAWTYPHVLGLDLAGQIEAVGDGVENWKAGMRVAGHLNLEKNGCFAEYVSVPTYELAEIPQPLSYADAAALLCGALTAYQSINRKPNLNNVSTVLVQAGSGSVGSLAIQFAHLHGLKVFTTASGRKKEFVEKTHPEAFIDYKAEDVAARVAELTGGHGVDLIVDPVGAAECEKDFSMLAYNGQLVAIVGVPDIDPGTLWSNGWSVEAVNLGGAHASGDPEQKKDLGVMATEVLQLAAQGEIDPLIGQVLPFGELVEGLEAIQRDATIGKTVVTLD